MTTDWKGNYYAETCTSEVKIKKNKNRHKQNFKDEANNMRLDTEETERSNLNNIYLSVTLAVKHHDSFISFYCAQ